MYTQLQRCVCERERGLCCAVRQHPSVLLTHLGLGLGKGGVPGKAVCARPGEGMCGTEAHVPNRQGLSLQNRYNPSSDGASFPPTHTALPPHQSRREPQLDLETTRIKAGSLVQTISSPRGKAVALQRLLVYY